MEKRGSFNGRRRYFYFHLIFPLAEQSNLPKSWFMPSAGLPTWGYFKRPEAEAWVPHRPGLPLRWIGATAPHFVAARPRRRVYLSTENLASQKASGIRLFSTLKVFIWKITLFV